MISIWVLASVVAAPTLWARQWEEVQANLNSSLQTEKEYFSEVLGETLCMPYQTVNWLKYNSC